MSFEVILRAGIATGTILIFASIGEIFAERSGVMNLGVEGMMLLGAMAAFKAALSTQNCLVGIDRWDTGRRYFKPGPRAGHHSFSSRPDSQRSFIDLFGDGTCIGAG